MIKCNNCGSAVRVVTLAVVTVSFSDDGDELGVATISTDASQLGENVSSNLDCDCEDPAVGQDGYERIAKAMRFVSERAAPSLDLDLP